MEMKTIARIHTGFHQKFGIPRQSGLVETPGYIVFEQPYNNPDSVRGLEEFSHIWIIWQFSEAIRDDWSPTVRPPRLGGNKRVGVFATRSPFRPNSLGLSLVNITIKTVLYFMFLVQIFLMELLYMTSNLIFLTQRQRLMLREALHTEQPI